MEAVVFSSYFPCIQYVSKFLLYDKICIDIHENYNRQTYRNRCRIQAANGVCDLSVPIKKNDKILVKDIEIDYSEAWQKNHYRAIMSAYKNSAFYDYYIDEFMPFFESKEKYLLDLNVKILSTTFRILKINPQYYLSKNFITGTEIKDFRNTIIPKIHKIEIDNEFKSIAYMQVFGERHGFAQNMSIIDLIFNEGPLSASIIKSSIQKND